MFRIITITALPILLTSCSWFPSFNSDSGKPPTNVKQIAGRVPISKEALLTAFENKIAHQLLGSPANRAQLIYSKAARISQLAGLQALQEQLTHLDQSRLSKRLKRQINQLPLKILAIKNEIKTWNPMSQRFQISQLIPRSPHQAVTTSDLEDMLSVYAEPQVAIENLLAITPAPSPLTISNELFEKQLLSLVQPTKSPIKLGLQDWHIYSPLSREQQIESLRKIWHQYTKNTISQLNQLEAQGNARPKNNNDINLRHPNTELLSKQFESELNGLKNKLLMQLSKPEFSKLTVVSIYKETAADYQDTLSLLSYYAEKNHGIGTEIFPAINENTSAEEPQVFLIAGHTNTIEPIFEVQNKTAVFDLTSISQLPKAELALINILYINPGYFLASQHQENISDQLFQVKAFRTGWSYYVLQLLADKGYFADKEQRIATNIRAQLHLSLALADLRLHSKQWDKNTTRAFLAANTPYSTQYLDKEFDSLIQNPGLAVEAYLIQIELMALKDIVIDKGEMTLKDWHKKLLDTGPASLNYLKQEMRAQL